VVFVDGVDIDDMVSDGGTNHWWRDLMDHDGNRLCQERFCQRKRQDYVGNYTVVYGGDWRNNILLRGEKE